MKKFQMMRIVLSATAMMSAANIPAANAGFLDSLSTIRSVVSDIGYTANSVSYAKNSAKEMSDNLGLTGKLGKSQATTDDSFNSGDVLVSKLATIKLYADSGKTQLNKTLSKADPMVFLGEEVNGMLHVSSDQGDGWVQKPLVGRD